MKKKLTFICLLLFLLAFPTLSFASIFDRLFSSETSHSLTEKRLSEWRSLIADSQNDSEWQKLNRVNRFFNKVRYSADIEQWGEVDYWATPTEFLTSNAGDCEDYAIAKFYTLIAMGINADNLRLTHVTITPSNQAHMVLLVKEEGSGALLTLDNRVNDISAFGLQSDLTPVYSFNNANLWINHTKDQIEKVGSVSQIKKWTQLKQRRQLQTDIIASL